MTTSNSRKQRGKREATFLETVRDALQRLAEDVAEIKCNVQELQSMQPMPFNYHPTSVEWPSMDLWQNPSFFDCNSNFVTGPAEDVLAYLNPDALPFAPTTSKATMFAHRPECFQEPCPVEGTFAEYLRSEVVPLSRDQLLAYRSAIVVGESSDDRLVCARAIAQESCSDVGIHIEICDDHCCDGIVYKQWQPSQQYIFKDGSSLDVALRSEAAQLIQQWYRRSVSICADVESSACSFDEESKEDSNSSDCERFDLEKFNAMARFYSSDIEDVGDRVRALREIDLQFGGPYHLVKLMNLPEDYDEYVMEGLLDHLQLLTASHFVILSGPRCGRFAFAKMQSQKHADELVRTLQGFEAWSAIKHTKMAAAHSNWNELDELVNV